MSSSHRFRLLPLTALLLSFVLPVAARAQETAGSSEIPARLRHLEGTVTVQRAAAGETEEAVINLPLGSGDRVWSADNGRVELMFEDGTTIWLDASTTLDFVSLPRPNADNGAILRLWTGSVFVQRPDSNAGAPFPLRLDTPSGAVSFDEAGLFRVDLDQEQTVWLSAYDGSAVLDAGDIAERVSAGNRAVVQAGSAPSRATAFNTSEVDAFSDWRQERFALYASTRQYAAEREYVPQTIVSYAADLEPYGSWSYHPTYASWYWRPYAAVAWTPYRDGRWVYTYGGWNWVPSAPWGYVTSHYGRWHYGSAGWMWFPGRVWTPASVHWYVGSGYVGWVPLNYYNQPAVSFGVHVGGGGFGVSVGINVGGYGGYPYYGYPSWSYPGWSYPGWTYPGWSYPYYGYKPYRRFPHHYAGYNRPVRYPSYRGAAYEVGPIGSASGRSRVVNGRGYSAGLADPWTVVPGDSFSSRSVGRAAVSRAALPKGLNQQSKALVSGALRARQPATLVPTDVRAAHAPTATSGRRAVPVDGTAGAVRQAAGSSPNSVSGAARRAATPRTDAVGRGSPISGSGRATAPGAKRSINAPASATRQAVPTTSQGRRPTASGAVRSTSGAATRSAPPSARNTTAPRSNTGNIAIPRTSARDRTPPASGATRQANVSPRSRTTVRTPPSSTRYPSSPAVRSTSRSTQAPRSAVRPTPSRNSGQNPAVRSSPAARPRTSAAPRPSVRPSGAARPSGSVRPSGAARPSGSVRPSGAVRPSGSVRPPVAPRPSGSSVRPPAARRPGGSAPSARPASPRRPSGGKATARPAKPRGGSST